MSYYLPTRKKIRGWKRRIRQLDSWGKWILKPNLAHYHRGDCTYERCTLYPFYMLEKRHPPLWFYKLMIARFIDAYYSWDSVFKEMGEPYDLLLWLYDPSFIRSEIVCYKGERRGFAWESTIIRPFSYKKFASIAYDINAFEWILADEENIYFESELEDEGLKAEDLLQEGWVEKEAEEDQVYYTQKTGDIWMGRLKR